MNAVLPESEAGWSAKKLWSMTLVLFVAQALTVMMLSDRANVQPRVAAVHPVITLLSEPGAGHSLLAQHAVSDPTLLALPSATGFSGPAWLKLSRTEHRLLDWSEPDQWLAQSSAQLGATFTHFVQASVPPPLLPADKPAPKASELELPKLTVREQSTYRLEGDLARRKLLTSPLPRSWPHNDLLANTEVELVVDRQGHVHSASLLNTTSPNDTAQRNADQYALKLVRGLRFEPLEASGQTNALMLGRIILEWLTVPLTQ
jgi:hypothetical protein